MMGCCAMHLAVEDILVLNRRCEALRECRTAQDVLSLSTDILMEEIGGSLSLVMVDPAHVPGPGIAIAGPDLDRDMILLQFERSERAWAELRADYFAGSRRNEASEPRVEIRETGDFEIYRRHFRSLRVERELGIELDGDGGRIGMLSIARGGHEPPFTDVEFAKGAVLGTAVRSALAHTIRTTVIEEADRDRSALCEAMSHDAFLLLDSQLTIRYADARATTLLAEMRQVQRRDDKHLPEALIRLTSECGPGTGVASVRETIELSDGDTVDISVRRVGEAGENCRYCVSLSADARTLPPVSVLREAGLTARQIDIVERMARGESNPEIANGLEISRFTVQSHVKAIYERLGVHSRVGLLVALNRLHV
jgi:DNA-binding CsgD family transcriptional regulator